MSIYKELSYNQDIDTIRGIQFSILGPDEIVRRSAVEITKTETYSGNEPVIGGLFDPRMGILEHGRPCATCEQKNTFCPGHFGHIKLARPVFHPLFFDMTRKVLGCVCFRCSRLMVSPKDSSDEYQEELRRIQGIRNLQKRWEAMNKLCGGAVSKGRRCGFDGGNGCGARQPSRYIKESAMKIIAEWKEGGDEKETTRKELMAEDVYRIFSRITDEDCQALGFNPTLNRPEYMICTVLPVPPPAVRPSIIEENGQRREDDLTHKLCDIVKTNNQLSARIEKGNQNEENLKLITLTLQYHIATFIDNQIPGLPPAQQRNGRKTKGIADRLKKKEGRIRGNLNGKRVDQSARSVITPDPYMGTDEVGVPVKIAMNTTFPEAVNPYNIEALRVLVRAGPDTWPGAKYVRSTDTGITKTLKNPNRDRIADELQIGDIVDRHLMTGDFILFNRQPSLHKMSMMGHKVKVMPYGTFRLNPTVCSAFNADFDGDEMNAFITQSIQSMSELMDLAAVPYMTLAPRDGKPIFEIIQDTMVGSFRLTKNFFPVSDRTFANLQMVNSYFRGLLPAPKGADGNYTGTQVFSQILPPGLHLESGKYRIEDSELVRGSIDKKVFLNVSDGMLASIFHDYGPFEAMRFADNIQRMVCRWLLTAGFSVGISDLVIDRSIAERLKDTIRTMKAKAYTKIDQTRNEGIENNSIFNNEDFFEREIINILNETTKMVGGIGLEQIDERTNRMINMVKSGSKGKETNVAQMIACVGQQNVDGKRVAYGFTDRTLPHFTKFDDGPEARGFVENSFISGLSPSEVFFHAMGGREGLIDTAVKSVVADTPLIVVEDGVAKDVMIGDWIDGYMEKYPLDIVVEDDRPDLEFLDIRDKVRVYIPTVDDYGNSTWGELTALTRHDPTEYAYDIETESGRTITVADSESLLIWDAAQKKYLKRHSSRVMEGDIVPMAMKIPDECPAVAEFIDMTQYFPKTEYVYGTEFNKCVQLMKEAQGSKFHIPRGWYEKNNGTTFTLPYVSKARIQRVLVRSNTENILDGCIYPYHATREHSHLPDRFPLDYENGVFIGLYLADGCYHESSGTLSISKEDKSVQEFVQNWFNKFGITNRIDVSVRPIGKTTSVIGSSTLFARFFAAMVGHGARNKHLPSVAYNAPLEFARGIISGYFSGDGWIGNGGVNVCSASRPLIEGIHFLCTRLGIFGKIRTSQQKKTNLGTTDIAPMHHISIRAQWGSKFAQTIQLIHTEKNAKLQNTRFAASHQNYSEVLDTVQDRIVKITRKKSEGLYAKMYDVTVPSTLNFTGRNGLYCSDTSETGYIQRRLVKAMEDCKVYYDNTVRNATGSIVQFLYGEDGMDGTKMETQPLPHIAYNSLEMDGEFLLRPEEESKLKLTLTPEAFRASTTRTVYDRLRGHYADIVADRDFLIERVFGGEKRDQITFPIPFTRLLRAAAGRAKSAGVAATPSDLDAGHILDTIDRLIERLRIAGPEQGTRFLKILVRANLSPKPILMRWRFHRATFDYIVSEIERFYLCAISPPGEMVGIVSAQTMGENSTQLVLDSFHSSGTVAAVKATSGVPRFKELLGCSKHIKTPILTIYLKPDIAQVVNPTDTAVAEAKKRSMAIMRRMEITRLADILDATEIYWDPEPATAIAEDAGFLEVYRVFQDLASPAGANVQRSPWVLRLRLNRENMHRLGLTMLDIYLRFKFAYSNTIQCVFSDDNAEELIFRVRLSREAAKEGDPSGEAQAHIDSDDTIAALKAIEHNMVHGVLLKGIKGIKKVSMHLKTKEIRLAGEDRFSKVSEWVLDTDGTNLQEILADPNVDAMRTHSNDVWEIYRTFGIEAARTALHREIMDVIGEDSLNYRHVSLLLDTMTNRGTLMSVDRHGINRGDVGPLAKCSFEETTDMLINASIFAEQDHINGVSANIMLGQLPPCGTGDCDVLLDEVAYIRACTEMPQRHAAQQQLRDRIPEIESGVPEDDPCGYGAIAFQFDLPAPAKSAMPLPEMVVS